MDIVEELKKESKRFNKIVVWGLRKRFHTHRYIYSSYYRILKKVGVPVIWVEDKIQSQKLIEKNDLIISAEVIGKMVPEKLKFEDYNIPVRDDIYYCLHNFKEIFSEKINPEKLLKLQVYNNKAENYEKIYEGVHFDKKNKILYQPWGTNLLPEEFNEPVFNRNKFIFWVGSVWNDKNMKEMISKVLSLNKNEYIGLVKKQQEICKNYTYFQHLNNIFKAFR